MHNVNFLQLNPFIKNLVGTKKRYIYGSASNEYTLSTGYGPLCLIPFVYINLLVLVMYYYHSYIRLLFFGWYDTIKKILTHRVKRQKFQSFEELLIWEQPSCKILLYTW